MFYINDDFYDDHYIASCFDYFDKDPLISQCAGKRFTVCMHNTALWIALCLYLKSNGGSVFPLAVDTPIEAAHRRAITSACHYLLFDESSDSHHHADNKKISIKTISAQKAVSTLPTTALAVKNGSLIQMSSGTTGDPKIIERSWESIDIEMAAYIQHFPEAHSMTPVVAAPVSHSYGLICGVLIAFERNVIPIIITHLNPKYILRQLNESHQPILYSSPVLINTLSLLIKSDQMMYAVMTSGTLLQEDAFERISSKTHHLYQQYGCSEVGCISLAKNITRYNDIGYPLPHHHVTAGNGKASAQELVVSQPPLLTTSSNNKEKNSPQKYSSLEITTGDMTYFDEKGSLHFVSRTDDMINVAGFNVYPSEVENVILTMPAVSDAVVFKRKHSLGNEQVCLNVVSTTLLAPEKIRQWCRAKLAAHQIPMHIEQVEEIPRLPNGKVSRKKLAESV